MTKWINGLTILASIITFAWMMPMPVTIIVFAGLAWFLTIDLRK